MPIPFLPLIALAATAYSIYNQNKAAKEQDKYNEKQDEYQKKLKEERERKERMDALQRAVRSKAIFAPSPYPDAPRSPEMSSYAMKSGLADLISQLGAKGMSGDYDKYLKPRIDTPYDNMFGNMKYNSNYSQMG